MAPTERFICLCGPTRDLGRCDPAHGAGHAIGPLFGLAPDGACRASSLALGAVGSYPTFSPLPVALGNRRFVFCGAIRRCISRCNRPHASRTRGAGYAASCPVEFGLSSPGRSRERTSALSERDKGTGNTSLVQAGM